MLSCSLQSDTEEILSQDLTECGRLCVVLRLCEKRLLQSTMEFAREQKVIVTDVFRQREEDNTLGKPMQGLEGANSACDTPSDTPCDAPSDTPNGVADVDPGSALTETSQAVTVECTETHGSVVSSEGCVSSGHVIPAVCDNGIVKCSVEIGAKFNEGSITEAVSNTHEKDCKSNGHSCTETKPLADRSC